MLLIPAIDLKDGKCVRLRQGRMDEETVFSDDPVATTERWVSQGARRMHIVDLNGAREGRPVNAEVIWRISQSFPDLEIQAGGGIRDDDAIQSYLDAGVRYAVIGTNAVSAPHFVSDACLEFPGHIIVALDAKHGKVAIDGWSKLSNHDVIDLAKRFEKDGVTAILFTDISRDGMMSGLNIEATAALARAVTVPIIASGGFASLDDIKGLLSIEKDGVFAAIIGRALYEGAIDFREAQKLVS